MNILPILQNARLHVEFFVPGEPATAGSTKGFVNPKTGKVVMAPDNERSLPWTTNVQGHAMLAMRVARSSFLADAQILLAVDFLLARPRSHYRKSGELRPDAPAFSTSHTRGDLTKLVRCLEDALTHIVWDDDSHVVAQVNSKPYANPGETPGARVRVYVIPK